MSTAEGQLLAKEYGTPFFETSALQNLNVDDAFNTVTTAVMHGVIAAEEAASGRKPANNKESKDSGGGKQTNAVRLDDITTPTSSSSSGCAC